MNKLTKGAIATAAGVILLMGGAGTLAAWNSVATTDQANGSTISSGQLNVVSKANGVWTNTVGGTAVALGSVKMVPGDSYTYTQTFNITASGNNLLFTVSPTTATFGSSTTGLAAALTKTATINVSLTGSNIAASTSANTYKISNNTTTTPATVTVTMVVAYPYGTAGDNTGQNDSVTLSGGAITLAQTQTP